MKKFDKFLPYHLKSAQIKKLKALSYINYGLFKNWAPIMNSQILWVLPPRTHANPSCSNMYIQANQVVTVNFTLNKKLFTAL